MPIDPQIQAIIDARRASGIELFHPGITPDEMRRRLAKWRTPQTNVPAMARVEDRVIPTGDGAEIPVRIYWPTTEPGPSPVVVYFHGGGWVIGDIEMSDATVKSLAAAAQMVFVSVDYGLAPEHRFPVGAEDCYEATAWVAQNAAALGVDETRLAVAGDSAGGNLATVVALMSRERGGPAISFQLLIYPCTDFDLTRPSMIDNGVIGLPSVEGVRYFYEHYLELDQRTHPFAAPIRADLAGSPPALVITAEYDPLRDEGNEYGARLQQAGVPATVSCYEGMIHGFFGMTAEVDKARDAQAEAVRALKRWL